MDKEKIIAILEDYEFFVDDDYGGHYEHIDCSQRARIPLGILEILDYISNLEQQIKKQKEIIDKLKEFINKYAYKPDILHGQLNLNYEEFNELLDILNGCDRMNINECIKQLNSLIEHFENGGNDFNVTDIMSIKGLLKEVEVYDSFKKILMETKKQSEKKWNSLKEQVINCFNKTQDVQFLEVLQVIQELEESDSQ